MIYTITAISTIIIVELLIKYKVFLSIPNSRSLHENEMPTSSGIALGFIVCIYYIQSSNPEMASIAFFICLLGALDDKFQISQLVRLVVQILIAVFIISYSFTWVYIFESLLLIFIFVYFINSYNFMDGIDLLGISQAIFILLSIVLIGQIVHPPLLYSTMIFNHNSIVLISLMLLSLMIIGYYNKTPSKIFLGSSGSYLLGLFITIILIESTTFFRFFVSNSSINFYPTINYFTPLILYTVFLVDTFYVLTKKLFAYEDSRLSNKDWIVKKIKKLTSPHKTHNYQKMVAQGMSHHKVVVLLMIYNVVWCLPLAIASIYYQNLASFCLVLSCLPYIIICNKNKAGVI